MSKTQKFTEKHTLTKIWPTFKFLNIFSVILGAFLEILEPYDTQKHLQIDILGKKHIFLFVFWVIMTEVPKCPVMSKKFVLVYLDCHCTNGK
jgi:hypothetical protein